MVSMHRSLSALNTNERSWISEIWLLVEYGIALQDAMNSDYFFRGTIKNDTIEIQPDVSVLQTWPKWAKPPSQQDLETCIVTLTKEIVG
jgi:hypothetical protein